MKMVTVVYGDTYSHRDQLKDLGFKWHAGDKVWVAFWSEESSPLRVLAIEDLSNQGVSVDHTTADWFIHTSVDPRAYKGISSPTGYQPPSTVVKNTSSKNFTFVPGDQLELGGGFVRNIKRELEMEIFFCNVEVVEVLAETFKAVRARIKFVSKIAESCHMCGRSLDDEVSKATGVGPICIKRLGIKKASVENAHLIIAELDRLVEHLGVTGPFWIPKSQIKRRLSNIEKVS